MMKISASSQKGNRENFFDLCKFSKFSVLYLVKDRVVIFANDKEPVIETNEE